MTIMIYSNRLKELREEKNISQQDIAKYLKIDNSLYAKYEKEYYVIPIKHLNTLSNYFNISFDYLFGLTNKLNYKENVNEIDSLKSGNRIKEFRKENKITQERLASELNMARSALANYERGRNVIATPFLYSISSIYLISADYLLGKIDEKINLN